MQQLEDMHERKRKRRERAEDRQAERERMGVSACVSMCECVCERAHHHALTYRTLEKKAKAKDVFRLYFPWL